MNVFFYAYERYVYSGEWFLYACERYIRIEDVYGVCVYACEGCVYSGE